mmetsp:Transcript_151931/g.487627  ORF Transcript_151931/g.487627 Transcript_151931/m.487627 type:complete len:224 (-) Transcript_151931:698-1369(-)
MRLHDAMARGARSEQHLLLPAVVPASDLDRALRTDLQLPTQLMEKGCQLSSGFHEILRRPLQLLVAEVIVPFRGFLAIPSVDQPIGELLVNGVLVPAANLDVADFTHLDHEVWRLPQRVVVASEDQLLLTVHAGLAVVPAVHGHQAPTRQHLNDGVAKLDCQQPDVVLALLATLLEDVRPTLVEAMAELFVAGHRRGAILLDEVEVQDIQLLAVRAADLDVAG